MPGERVRSRSDVSSFPPLARPLSDGAVTLRPSAERDIPEVLIAYQDDPELHLRLGEDRPPSGAHLGRRAELADQEWWGGSSLTLAIVAGSDDTCLGEVRAASVDWQHLRVEVCVWVAVAHRGTGLGRRALALSSQWLLAECGLERVGLMVDPGNVAMRHAAIAAGFAHEGVLRGYAVEQGRRRDKAVFSRVRSDLAA